jgi:hypothetical protein
MGIDSMSPSISPESHNSDTSVEVSETRLLAGGGIFLNNTKYSPDQRPGSNGKDVFVPFPFASLASLGPSIQHPTAFFPPSTATSQNNTLLFPPTSFLYRQPPPKPHHHNVLKNNNNHYTHNNNNNGDVCSKRIFLDAILRSQQSSNGGSNSREGVEEEEDDNEEEEISVEGSSLRKRRMSYTASKRKSSRMPASPHQDDPEQENPIDLSMKGCQDDERLTSPEGSVDDEVSDQEEEERGDVAEENVEQDDEYESMANDHKERHSRSVAAPIDLTTRA